jgi:RNA polymerase sigma-70 factor (sigma-E family)
MRTAKATIRGGVRLLCVGLDEQNRVEAAELTGGRLPSARPGGGEADPARAEVAALYAAQAVGLIRLAVVMLGDRAAAEDVVQEAFLQLYRRWRHLSDAGRALPYVRSAVLNGCRSVLRQRGRHLATSSAEPAAASAESAILIDEEHRRVLDALRRLPPRQREALVLRFYLELPASEIARSMGISPGTVKSTTSRALAALGRQLREEP